MYECAAGRMRGKKFVPRAVGKKKEADFYIPDCPDYKPRINIPIKVKANEVLTAWHCRNCKNFKAS